jgi:ankyrin repeat protein
VEDREGWTTLHRAANGGHEIVSQLLLDHKSDVVLKDKRKRTALHLAAKEGHETVVHLLLHHKANINTKDRNG